MKNLILAPAVFLFLLLPGDATGFPHGAAHRAAPAYHPAAGHTPAFVAPHYSAPHISHYAAPRYVAPRAPVATYRPAAPIRTAPALVNREPFVTRPGASIATRPRGVPGDHFASVNRLALANRGVNIHRANGLYRPGYAHYHDRYAGWHHGYWNGWYTRPWLWFGGGVAAGWLMQPGEGVDYSDPYYLPPGPQVVPVFDYSQPIAVPVSIPIDADTSDYNDFETPPPPASSTDDNAATAAKLLDDARQAFRARDYAQAQQLADQAITMQPNDTTLHEFRALTLFAQQKYQEAAATIYAVLAVGPGWDWDTMRGLYADTATYTNQLRALEQYTKSHPQDAAARFLLAYQYLVLGSLDAAARTLQSVVALKPNDQLAAYLLQMVSKKDSNRPAPGT